jgi:hypothetical protein
VAAGGRGGRDDGRADDPSALLSESSGDGGSLLAGFRGSIPGGRRAAGLLVGLGRALRSANGDCSPLPVDAELWPICPGTRSWLPGLGNAPSGEAGRSAISGRETEFAPGGMTSRFWRLDATSLSRGSGRGPSGAPEGADSPAGRLGAGGGAVSLRGTRGVIGLRGGREPGFAVEPWPALAGAQSAGFPMSRRRVGVWGAVSGGGNGCLSDDFMSLRSGRAVKESPESLPLAPARRTYRHETHSYARFAGSGSC